MDYDKRLRPINIEEARENFAELELIACEKKVSPLSRVGLKTLDYFFLKHRLRAKTKKHISFFEAMKDKKIVSYLNEKIRKIRANPDKIFNDKDELLRHQYSAFQLYFGTINQFRPTEALRIYCELKPKKGILDFSAGWGGRCLAAMVYNVPYIGIDTNAALKTSYGQMHKLIKPDADVKIIISQSEKVDFSKFNYDLIFTSPPYFMLEEYEDMPLYKNNDDFIDKFFRPVIENSWHHLKKGGHMALNMPAEMYQAVRYLLPPITKKIKLPIANRHPSNAASGREPGSQDQQRFEYTYIWKKVNNTLRKTRKSNNKTE
jgi:hypothetical protein